LTLTSNFAGSQGSYFPVYSVHCVAAQTVVLSQWRGRKAANTELQHLMF